MIKIYLLNDRFSCRIEFEILDKMLKKLKKFSFICVLSLVLVGSQPTPSYALGGIFKLIGKFFDEITNIFKGETRIITKSDNPDFKSLTEEIDKFSKSAQSNPFDEVVKTKSTNKIYTENQDSIEIISGLKKEASLEQFSAIRKNKAQELLEVVDLQEYFEDISFEGTKKTSKFSSFQQLNWSGRIYRSEEYYKKPTLDKKLLLECHFNQDVFFLFIILEDKIKEAILDEHISNSSFLTKLNRQKLAVIVDKNRLKIMSTFPLNDNEYPRNFFILKDNRKFMVVNTNGKTNPHSIIMLYGLEEEVRKNNSNQCFKVLKSGLIKE